MTNGRWPIDHTLQVLWQSSLAFKFHSLAVFLSFVTPLMINQVRHAPIHLIGFDKFILLLQSLKIPSLLHDILLQFAIFRIRFTSLPQTWGHFRQQTVLPPRKSRPSEEYIVLKGNYSRLAWLHLRLQVRLVADEEDHSVGVGQVARVCQPGGEVVVSRPVNKIILGNIFSTCLVMKLL